MNELVGTIMETDAWKQLPIRFMMAVKIFSAHIKTESFLLNLMHIQQLEHIIFLNSLEQKFPQQNNVC